MNTIRKYWKTHISFQNNENIFYCFAVDWEGKELWMYSSHFYGLCIFQYLKPFYYFNKKQISKCTCKKPLYVTIQTDLLLTTFPFRSEGSLSLQCSSQTRCKVKSWSFSAQYQKIPLTYLGDINGKANINSKVSSYRRLNQNQCFHI